MISSMMEYEGQIFRYEQQWRQGGAERMLWSAVVAVFFSLILLWGYGKLPWAAPADLAIVACCAAMYARGLWIRRMSAATVVLDGQSIRVNMDGKELTLGFEAITEISMEGILQPSVLLRGGEISLRVYKTLYGYPVFWSNLRGRLPMPPEAHGDMTVRCNRVARSIPLLISFGVAALLLAFGFNSLAQGESLGLAAAILALALVTAAVPGIAIAGSVRTLRCTKQEIACKTLFWQWHCPANELERLTLSQEKKRKLDTPSSLPAYRRLPPLRGYALVLTLRRKDGSEFAVSELMTGYPLELLAEYLALRYHVDVLFLETV